MRTHLNIQDKDQREIVAMALCRLRKMQKPDADTKYFIYCMIGAVCGAVCVVDMKRWKLIKVEYYEDGIEKCIILNSQ